MTYKLEPPFEIYHDGKQIADKNGHICSAEDTEIAKAILAALEATDRLRPKLIEANCPRASWCAPVVDDASSPASSQNRGSL